MKAVERVWWMSVGAIVAFIFILFAIYNSTPVVVDVYVRRYLVEVWVVVLLSFVAGLFVPVGFIVAQRMMASRRERAYRRDVEDLRQELDALRNAALVEPLAGSVAPRPGVPALPPAGGGAGASGSALPSAQSRRVSSPSSTPGVPSDTDGDLAGA